MAYKPFIGEDYGKDRYTKILFLGESHYIAGEDWNQPYFTNKLTRTVCL